MKVILYMAISADGFIATKDGDSDWVSQDDPGFEEEINKANCLIVGRRTYDQYYGDLYPFPKVDNIIVSSRSLNKTEKQVFLADSPKEAINIAKSRNHTKAILIGGGTLNGSFLKQQLIDEIQIVVHNLILGEGISLFESISTPTKLSLKSTSRINDQLVRLTYKVNN